MSNFSKKRNRVVQSAAKVVSEDFVLAIQKQCDLLIEPWEKATYVGMIEQKVKSILDNLCVDVQIVCEAHEFKPLRMEVVQSVNNDKTYYVRECSRCTFVQRYYRAAYPSVEREFSTQAEGA